MNEMMVQFRDFVLSSVKTGIAPALIVFIVHVIASKMFNAYEHYPPLDIPMHFIGGMVICFFFWCATKAPHSDIFLGKHTSISLFILLITSTGTTTVLWEFAEWINDAYFGGNSQGSIRDTMGDMFLGLAGGLIVSFYASVKHQSAN